MQDVLAEDGEDILVHWKPMFQEVANISKAMLEEWWMVRQRIQSAEESREFVFSSTSHHSV